MHKASLNVTGAKRQAKLEPIAMHKPPQEIFARIGNLVLESLATFLWAGLDRPENCHPDHHRRRPTHPRGESLRDDPTPMGGLDAPHLGSEGGARRGAADLYPLKS